MGKDKPPMRGVFPRPPGSDVYWINYYDADGKRHREKIGRYSVAVEAYLQRRQEVREGKFSPPRASPGSTFRELAELAIANKKMRNSPESIRNDNAYLKKLGPEFRDFPFSKLTPGMIETRLQKFREAGMSGSTANRYLNFISSVYGFAIRTGRATFNPCVRVPRQKENPPRVRFLYEEEEERLRKVIRAFCPEYEAELDLALYTGIRRGEQWKLKRENVNLRQGILTVIGKVGPRHVPISSHARSALEFLLKHCTDPDVIRTRRRQAKRDWRRWLEWCIGEAGIPNFKYHDLRHTFASRLVMAGVDLRTVQELLGHKSYRMTLRYAHLAPDHMKAAVEKIVPKTEHSPTPSTPGLRVVRVIRGGKAK